MSGEYKLGELLYQATLDKDFVETIQDIRTKYNIPKDGHTSIGEAVLNEDMVVECYKLQISYGIPHTNSVAVYHYALYGVEDWDNYQSHTDAFYILEHPKKLRTDIADVFDSTKQPYVKLLIPSYASLRDVKECLNKKWQNIQSELNKQGGGSTGRIRRTKHKNRNQLILMLNKKTKNELSLEYGEETNKPKDIMIANILKDNYGHTASSEQTRSIPYRSRKK